MDLLFNTKNPTGVIINFKNKKNAMIDELTKYFHKPELVNKSLVESDQEGDILRFIDSHILKANIARIVGLVSLLHKKDDEYRDEIMSKLEVEVNELEVSVSEIKQVITLLIKQ